MNIIRGIVISTAVVFVFLVPARAYAHDCENLDFAEWGSVDLKPADALERSGNYDAAGDIYAQIESSSFGRFVAETRSLLRTYTHSWLHESPEAVHDTFRAEVGSEEITRLFGPIVGVTVVGTGIVTAFGGACIGRLFESVSTAVVFTKVADGANYQYFLIDGWAVGTEDVRFRSFQTAVIYVMRIASSVFPHIDGSYQIVSVAFSDGDIRETMVALADAPRPLPEQIRVLYGIEDRLE